VVVVVVVVVVNADRSAQAAEGQRRREVAPACRLNLSIR